MALPILGIAAGIAARAAAKKAASRAVGGIAGKGAKQVNPVYRMMDKQTTSLSKSVKINKAEARANKRALKAANKPKSKNINLDRDKSDMYAYDKAAEQFKLKTGNSRVMRGTDNLLKNTPPARPNRIRGGSMKSKLNWPKGM